MSADALLQLDAVTKRYGGVTALRDFSLDLGADDARIVALAGQSGAGKTTALQIALGLLAPTSGAVSHRGAALKRLGRAGRKRFRHEVQAVPQDPYAAFNPFYRVRHVFDVIVRNFDIPDAPHAVAEAIEFVGLDPGRLLAAFPHELSGGERQRALLARALLLRPRLIVADEPLALVDAPIRSAILDRILELREQIGISFLYATHDLATAYQIADELIVLREGETVERGAARDVIDAPQHAHTRELVDAVPEPDRRAAGAPSR